MCGMKISIGKCASLKINFNDSRWYADPRDFLKLDGEMIKAMSIESTYKYLGIFVGFKELGHTVQTKLTTMLANLTKAPLKPQQRLIILKDYLIRSCCTR